MVTVVAQSPVWHYWLGVVLFIAALATVAGVIVGYVTKVQSLKYPKHR
jgi:formate-dependent nitrite reductase membrane component NrfD